MAPRPGWDIIPPIGVPVIQTGVDPHPLVAVPDVHSDTEAAEGDWGRTFIGLAALGINSRRSYIVALLRILASWLGFQVIVYAILVWIARSHRQFFPIALVLGLFLSVIVAGAAVARSVARTHRRPWLSLVSPSLAVDWRRLAIGAGVQAVLVLAMFVALRLIGAEPPSLQRVVEPSVMALALLLIPFQAASEEILFRGYLTQALGRVFRSRGKIVVAVALLFAALHLNTYGPLTMPYMFVVSLALSAVSLRDERLELAIGAHAATNWIGVGTIGSLIYRDAALRITWFQLSALIVDFVLFYVLTRVFVRRFRDR
jgi:membrane protease YdiL (CAAX protease family)